jgi:16S rRNA (guanine527-N7)-methyltransferase
VKDASHQLAQGLNTLGLPLPEAAQTRLLAYLDLLSKWNHKHNLTAVRKLPDMITRHLLDCMAVLPYIQGSRVLDVGTGAGLPGIVLAVARPDWHCVLLDSHARKSRFVTQAIIELQLNNAEAVCSRIEQYQPSEGFDTVISRAYSSLAEFYRQTQHVRKANSLLLAMKGTLPIAELEEIQSLGLKPQAQRLHVPGLDAERHVLLVRHQSYTEELH